MNAPADDYRADLLAKLADVEREIEARKAAILVLEIELRRLEYVLRNCRTPARRHGERVSPNEGRSGVTAAQASAHQRHARPCVSLERQQAARVAVSADPGEAHGPG